MRRVIGSIDITSTTETVRMLSSGHGTPVLADTLPEALLGWAAVFVGIWALTAVARMIQAPKRKRAATEREATAAKALAEWKAKAAKEEAERKAKKAEETRESERKANAEEMRRRKQLRKALDKTIKSNKDLVDRFLDIADRKVSIIDDYGEEDWDALPGEIDRCVNKIRKRGKVSELLEEDPLFESLEEDPLFEILEEDPLKSELEKLFRNYHAHRKSTPASITDIDSLSGVDFEAWIAKLLREKGFQVYGTPATGDQGADLIANKDGKSIVIQAKRRKALFCINETCLRGRALDAPQILSRELHFVSRFRSRFLIQRNT